MALLAVDGLHVRYGGIAAVRGVSLTVNEGEIVSIIGPNGAGKSSTLGAIAGGVAVERGSIRYAGGNIAGKSPEDIARAGLSLVPEGRHVFGTLTVAENLAVGTFMRPGKHDIEPALALFPRLKERLHYPAGRLSGGEQQMLALARAMLTRPKLMLVDEPSLGLAPIVVDQVYATLLDLRRREGMSLLIVEQSSHRILKHADRICVLRNGRLELEGNAADLKDGEAIKQAYFGFGQAAHPEARP
jgi:branched-chain amino acid transport system ATP-binding protein